MSATTAEGAAPRHERTGRLPGEFVDPVEPVADGLTPMRAGAPDADEPEPESEALRDVSVLYAMSGQLRQTWRRALESGVWAARGRVLKHEARDGSWVRRMTLDGRAVVVKSRPARGGVETLKRALHLSRGWRQARGARRLAGAQAPAAPVLLLATGIDPRGVRREVVACPAFPGLTVLEHLDARDLSRSRETALARNVAQLVRRIARAGLLNRDGKPSNLIASGVTAFGAHVVTLDTVGVVRRPWQRTGLAIERMLAGLVIEPMGVGAPVRRTVMARALAAIEPSRDERKRMWRRIARRVARHGDPRPATDPRPSAHGGRAGRGGGGDG